MSHPRPPLAPTHVHSQSGFLSTLPDVGLTHVDHCVGNQADDSVDSVSQWYEESLSFQRFWSTDYEETNTQYSDLRSVVISNPEGTIRFPLTEAAPGLRKSQVTEFNEYNGGPGIQHIGIHTEDIIQSEYLTVRGCVFGGGGGNGK